MAGQSDLFRLQNAPKTADEARERHAPKAGIVKKARTVQTQQVERASHVLFKGNLMAVIEIPTLHDSTLRAIALDWESVVLEIEIAEAPLTIGKLAFSGVVSVVISRRQEWGPSASIMRFHQIAEGQFGIEMQSGDVLRIDASAVSWSG